MNILHNRARAMYHQSALQLTPPHRQTHRQVCVYGPTWPHNLMDRVPELTHLEHTIRQYSMNRQPNFAR